MAGVLAVFAIVLLVIVIVPGVMWAKKRADNINAADQLADQEAARIAGEKARQIVCQHCRTKGFVTTQEVRIVKLRIASAAIGVALIATACGGKSSGTPVAQSPVSSPPVVSATPTPSSSPVSVGPKGILTWTGTGSVSSGTAMTGYDPVTKQQSSLSILGDGSVDHCAYVVPNSGGSGTSVSVRQSYSPNFDKVTWCSGSSSEGSTASIGYVDASSGTVHNLTPDKGSSYGAQSPQQVLPIFNPKTGDLWFYDVNLKSFMSFDLSNPGQAPQKRSAPAQAMGINWPESTPVTPDPTKIVLGNKLLFSDDGSTLVATVSNVAVAPDGKSAIVGHSDTGLALQGLNGASNADLKWAPGTELSSCGPYPGAVFIDSTSFLCTGTLHASDHSAGDHASLYRVTVNGSTLTSLQLLPDSENAVQNSITYPGLTPGFVVSPDKQSVAFVASVSGEGDVLFTVPLKGGEPTQIGSFTGTMLIDWK
jgi:hypothetical protein